MRPIEAQPSVSRRDVGRACEDIVLSSDGTGEGSIIGIYRLMGYYLETGVREKYPRAADHAHGVLYHFPINSPALNAASRRRQ